MGHVLKKVAAWLCTVGVACGLGWAALTAGTGPVTAPAVAEARPATAVEAQYPGLKDNFYEAVNRDWFDRWDVPPTDAYVDNFYCAARRKPHPAARHHGGGQRERVGRRRL